MYLKTTEAQRIELLKILEIDENDLKKDVTIIREWMKQQKHLPQDDMKDDLLVEMFLLCNKMRIDQTKTKLDNYYTMIRIHNILFQDLWRIVPSTINIFKVPLRRLTEDMKRILIIGRIPDNNEESSFLIMLRAQILVSEMSLRFNYCSTQILILDMKGFTSNIFRGFDMSLMFKLIRTLKTCYSGRVAQIHIINSSSLVGLLVPRLQNMFGEKVKVHRSMESLYQYVPQKYLPKEYGGEDISLREYLQLWDEIVKEQEELLRSIPTKTADESLRIGKLMLDTEIFGVDGTFKKLNID